jgi:hypothetical protein
MRFEELTTVTMETPYSLTAIYILILEKEQPEKRMKLFDPAN